MSSSEPSIFSPDEGLRRLLELSCDWHWTLDAHYRLVGLAGRHLDAGPHALLVQLGRPPWEWPGVLAAEADFAELRQALLQRQVFLDLGFKQRDHRGLLRYLSASGYPFASRDGTPAGFRGSLRDLTRHRRAEALAALEHAVTRRLADAATSRAALQAVMQVICESEQWETAGFFRVEDELGTTRLVAGWSGPGMAAAAAEYYKQTSDRLIPAGGMISRVVATGQPLWVDDLMETQTTWAQRVQRTGERATFFFPVPVGRQVVGVFAFASREFREPDGPLLATLRAIGEQVGQFLQRKEAQQVLRESEARFRALTELSSDWYWEIDADWRLTRIEGRYAEGLDDVPSGEGAKGKRRWETGLEIEAPDGWEAHRAQLEARQPFRDTVLMQRRAGGNPRFISISGEPMVDHRGTFLGYRGIGRDITDRKLAEKRIEHLATHDGLTGLPNRVLFHELLAMAIRSARRDQLKVALLFIDLDRFKAINDTLGHEAGDAVLKEMAQRLTGCLRTSDVVARLGGDEFVVLLPRVEGDSDVTNVARKIIAAAGQPIRLQGGDYQVTASVGISIHGIDANDEQSLMRHADAAMYAAKQNGKNGFQYYPAPG
jgi:diguanylate cyclase (GGDEF)-like protein